MSNVLTLTKIIWGKTVNKNDLVTYVANASGLGKTEATKAVDGVFEAIKHALSHKDDVRLVGFGTFTTSERKATKGRNPRTGEEISIAASVAPKFKPGKDLKDAVTNSKNVKK